jgi:hypothetical protein
MRTRDDEVYRCGVCHKQFIRGWVKCLVNHLRGDCCHYGDIYVEEPAGKEEKIEVSE